ncbi:hypothetical protein [Halogeometricum luteum]|uniref:Uncharacterized protein n=1 Tax=Halogeometricum luteum TaxID=2950537 RepID=A0ABU2FVP2_9EURY|nr:hypothetical protein [Halogeometricum sp. S3BR5-2]MDS0292601.1 hypothetical protein [Halogeometricum sp. S3BR5-2]
MSRAETGRDGDAGGHAAPTDGDNGDERRDDGSATGFYIGGGTKRV